MYLSKILDFPKDKKVYLIGEKGLEDELKSVGIQYAGGTVGRARATMTPACQLTPVTGHQDPADNKFLQSKDFSEIIEDPSVGAVLCGFDMHVSAYSSRCAAGDPLTSRGGANAQTTKNTAKHIRTS